MSFRLLGSRLTPSEGERTVRTYHCTSLSSGLLRLKAEGYLTITNMRVVFYAYGSSYGGESVMHSEVPISDVSGINTYKGTYFSISHMLIALVISFIAGSIIGGFVTGLVGVIVAYLTDSLELNVTRILLIVIGLVIALVSNSYPEDNIRRPVLAATGASVVAGGGITIAFGFISTLFRTDVLSVITILLTLATGIYALVTLFWYARRETMSLTIGSKGGSNTPIAIAGATVLGLFNTAALKALTAEPAHQSDTLIRELGAVISDIQMLGDTGISKWESR